jgi:Na+-driven multidrug efflux pump
MQSRQQTLLAAFGMVVSQIDKIILGILNTNLLAIYSVGANIPIKIKDNAKSLLAVPVLHWGGKEKKEHFESIRQHGVHIFSIGVLISMFLIAVSPFLIPTFYGSKYSDAIRVNQFMSVFIGFNFFSTLVLSADLIQNIGKFYSKISILRNCLYLLLLFLLIGKIKIYGIVIAFLSCEFLAFTVSLIFYIKELKKIRIQ